MNRSTRLALLFAVPILLMSFLLVARTSDQAPVHWALPSTLVAIFALAVIMVVRDLTRMFRASDPEARAIAERLGKSREQRLLIERWLRRSRWYRNVGGAAGLIAGLIAGGMGGLILGGLAGVTAGSLLAELHLVRPDRRRGHRIAGLERRTLASYWNPRHQVAMLVVAVMGLGLFLAHTFGLTQFGFRSMWALAAVIAVLVAVFLQWRVAVRRRPALPSSLRGADNLVRSLAITQGIANPTIALAVAFLARSLWISNPWVSLAAWLLAIALFWGGRRLGLDWLLDRPPLAGPLDGPIPGSPAGSAPTQSVIS